MKNSKKELTKEQELNIINVQEDLWLLFGCAVSSDEFIGYVKQARSDMVNSFREALEAVERKNEK